MGPRSSSIVTDIYIYIYVYTHIYTCKRIQTYTYTRPLIRLAAALHTAELPAMRVSLALRCTERGKRRRGVQLPRARNERCKRGGAIFDPLMYPSINEQHMPSLIDASA